MRLDVFGPLRIHRVLLNSLSPAYHMSSYDSCRHLPSCLVFVYICTHEVQSAVHGLQDAHNNIGSCTRAHKYMVSKGIISTHLQLECCNGTLPFQEYASRGLAFSVETVATEVCHSHLTLSKGGQMECANGVLLFHTQSSPSELYPQEDTSSDQRLPVEILCSIFPFSVIL